MISVQLPHNQVAPILGFGTFTLSLNDCFTYTLKAIQLGFRHIDTAQVYKNEIAVGYAWKASGVSRENLFITSKIWTSHFGYEKAKKTILLSLETLQTDYLDLYLLHRPFGDYVGAWKALVEAQAEGKLKNIGVSNFNAEQIKELEKATGVRPAVNQIELHPYYQQRGNLDWYRQQGIAVQSWFPLGHGDKRLIEDATIQKIAAAHGVSSVQVLLRWQVQQGIMVFPCSRNEKHIQSNFEIFDFALTEQEMQAIEHLDRGRKGSYDTAPLWFQKLIAHFQC